MEGAARPGVVMPVPLKVKDEHIMSLAPESKGFSFAVGFKPTRGIMYAVSCYV